MTRKSRAQQDYEAYCERSAEIDRRIEAGESIMDIMRADQLERGKAAIARLIARHQEDSA